MTRGRRPTPTHLRLLRGNPQHRPMPKGEPAAARGDALMPPWLRVLDVAESGIEEATVEDLRARARAAGIKGLSRASKGVLVEALVEAEPGPRELAWQELASMLGDMHLLTAADVHALAMTIDAYVDYIGIRRTMILEGATYMTSGRYGVQVKRRPEFEMATKRWEQTKAGLIEFGMTPASRTKVAAVPAGDDDEAEFDELTKKGSAG